MDVRLKPFDFSQALARTGALTDAAARRIPPPHGQRTPRGLLRRVQPCAETRQRRTRPAGCSARSRSTARPSRSEETMIAMQRSNIGFQMALQVRNRVVQAYSEVMSMQV